MPRRRACVEDVFPRILVQLALGKVLDGHTQVLVQHCSAFEVYRYTLGPHRLVFLAQRSVFLARHSAYVAHLLAHVLGAQVSQPS